MKKVITVVLMIALVLGVYPSSFAYAEVISEPSAEFEIKVPSESDQAEPLKEDDTEDPEIPDPTEPAADHNAEDPTGTEIDEPQPGSLIESTEDIIPLEIKPLATPAATGDVQSRIDQLRGIFPHGSYFSVSRSACGHGRGSCSNCQLSNIMTSLGYSGLQGIYDSWTCVAFAKFAFWYVFGVADNTSAYSGAVPQGATKVSLGEAKLGDLVVFNGHYGIYLGVNGGAVSIYDSNTLGTNQVGYNVTYHSASNVLYVLRANNYDAIDSEEGEEEGLSKRLAGTDRYKTMTAILQEGFAKGSADTVIVATGENYPDALAASGLAGLKKAPIVLTSKATLTAEAQSEIQRLGAKKAIIIGSADAVSTSVESALKSKGLTVQRIAGVTRVETALEIYKAATGWSKTAIIASGSGFADALSISSYSYAKKAPIFLADGNKVLTKETLATIQSGSFTNIVIVGSDAAVSNQVETQLKNYKITRIGGADRYETSLQVAQYALKSGLKANNVAMATGANFPDALTGATLCGKNNAVIMLVADNATAKGYAKTLLSANKGSIKKAYILGSRKVIPASLKRYLDSCCG